MTCNILFAENLNGYKSKEHGIIEIISCDFTCPHNKFNIVNFPTSEATSDGSFSELYECNLLKNEVHLV